MDHAVLVVGYGEESDGRKYWLVKNRYKLTNMFISKNLKRISVHSWDLDTKRTRNLSPRRLGTEVLLCDCNIQSLSWVRYRYGICTIAIVNPETFPGSVPHRGGQTSYPFSELALQSLVFRRTLWYSGELLSLF